MAPIVEKMRESHHKTMKRYSSSVTNEIELLRKCLDALFENKIYEARKCIPLITQSFKNDAVARLFVPELVQRLTTYGGFLGPEQFDILVKLMNSAMVQEAMAARLLPLATAFYRVRTYWQNWNFQLQRILLSLSAYGLQSRDGWYWSYNICPLKYLPYFTKCWQGKTFWQNRSTFGRNLGKFSGCALLHL